MIVLVTRQQESGSSSSGLTTQEVSTCKGGSRTGLATPCWEGVVFLQDAWEDGCVRLQKAVAGEGGFIQ